MTLGDWHEELLNRFKNVWNGPIIDFNLCEAVNFHFESQFSCFTKDRENLSGTSYCGTSFKKDDLLYHCSDCALDETCVLCEKCFNFEVHKSHNYWYTIGKNNSGSCDCGEEDSWKSDLKCCIHSDASAANATKRDPSIDIKSLLELKLAPLLQFVIETLNDYRLSRSDTKDGENCVLLLYNDEKHSFNDVIEILTTEIGVSADSALKIASNGIECIYYSSGPNCLRLSRKFRTLETSVETFETAFNVKLASAILQFVSDNLRPDSHLQLFFKDWFLRNSVVLDSDCEPLSNIEFLFRYDHMFWKCIRQIFSDYLNSCNAIDQEAKKNFAATYCRYYCDIYNAFLKEKREPHLSITNFSVQIFTLTPVAQYCVEETGILESIIGKMTEILEPGFHHSSGLDFAKLRNFNYQKFTILTHDLLHLTRHVRSCRLPLSHFAKVLDSFMYLLSLLTHMQGHFIKTGDHVLYERDNYDGANYITFELQQVGQELVRIWVTNYEVSPIWMLFEKYIDQKASLLKLLLNPPPDNPHLPLFKSKKRASFFGSLAWFFSCFLKEILCKYPDSSIPSKLTKCFALDSLNRIIFSAEVRSGLWVRNGLVVRQQEYFYSSTVYHHLTYFPDMFNILAGSRLNDKIPFINMIAKQFCVLEYLQDQSQNGPVIDQFMILFLNCCSSASLTIDHEQIFINSLCTEAQTKTSLVSILPDCVGDCPEFREMVFKFAKLSHLNTLGTDSKLEIKPEYIERCDPIYWAYSANFRLKTWGFFKEKNSMQIQCLYNLVVSKYRISLEISREGDFLVDLLLHFAESSSNESQFSFELVIVLLKVLFDMSFDPRLAAKIASCIENFGEKKNISEAAMKFMSDIISASKNSILPDKAGSRSEKIGKSIKSCIISRFKRQRTAFMDDSVVSDDDDGLCCVICSESNSDSEALCFPVQVNQSSVMLEQGSTTSIIKGCYHLVHKSCFESLPKTSHNNLYKVCTLCNSAIDFILPYFPNENDFKSKDLTEIKISKNNSDLNNLDDIITFSDSTSMIDIHLKYLASTLCYLSAREMDLSSIPMYQILTLIQLKRCLVSRLEKLSIFEFNSSFLNGVVNSLSPITALELIIPTFIFYLSGRLSPHDAGRILSKMIFLSGYGNWFNLALNLIRNEYITSSRIFDKIDYELQDQNQNLKMNNSLISLPSSYDDFLKVNLKRPCDQCGCRSNSSALCLLCGALVCVGRSCISTNGQRYGGCYTHRVNCSGNVGIFMMVRNCALLLTGDSIGTIIPAPYLNAYGEHDIDLSSMCALNLNNQLYYGKLHELWNTLELRDFILRNVDKSTIIPQSWTYL